MFAQRLEIRHERTRKAKNDQRKTCLTRPKRVNRLIVGARVFRVREAFSENLHPADDYNSCTTDQPRKEQDFDDPHCQSHQRMTHSNDLPGRQENRRACGKQLKVYRGV